MKKVLFAILLIFFGYQSSIAQQISIENNGTLIHYRILSTIEKTAAVTFGTKFGDYSGEISIPSHIAYNHDTYTVTKIDIYAFYNCVKLSSIALPNTITEIGEFAFYGCKELRAITIPENVRTIVPNAFANCKQLTSVSLLNPATIIKDGAFTGCKNLALTNAQQADKESDSMISAKEELVSEEPTIREDKKSKHTSSVEHSKCYLSLQINDSRMGSVIGEGEYMSGWNIEISAKPNKKYRFVEWHDGNSENPRKINLTRDTLMMAIFEAIPQSKTHHITLTTNDSRMGYCLGSGQYLRGIDAKITAIPNEGYRFEEWSDGNTENPRILIVTKDMLLMANFAKGEKPTHPIKKRTEQVSNDYRYITLTMNDMEMGNVVGSGRYEVGEYVQIAAVPNKNFSFEKWSDGNTSNPRMVAVVKDTLLMATFVSNQPNEVSIAYTLTVVPNDTTLGKTLGKGMYRKGTQTSIAAIPMDSCIFEKWSDGNTDNPRKVEVNQDTFLKAIFSRIVHVPSVLEKEVVVRDTIIITPEPVVAPPRVVVDTVVVEVEKPIQEDESRKEVEVKPVSKIVDSMAFSVSVPQENMAVKSQISETLIMEESVEETSTEIDESVETIDEEENKLNVSYNPYNDIVTISAKEVDAVKVYNSMNKKIAYFENQNEISFASFAVGQYMLLITTPDGKFIRRIDKE